MAQPKIERSRFFLTAALQSLDTCKESKTDLPTVTVYYSDEGNMTVYSFDMGGKFEVHCGLKKCNEKSYHCEHLKENLSLNDTIQYVMSFGLIQHIKFEPFDGDQPQPPVVAIDF
jgi:hypothetical protein